MGSPRKELEYVYDSRGNRRALIDQDGGRFTYTYDAVNRITQVINPQGDRTSYSYDPAGRRTLKRMANGTRASFSYDPAGNLTGLYNLKSNGDVISSFNYQYDRVGNRTAVLEADGSRVTWSYDATYQLTGEHRTGTTPYEDTYSYDQVGNRLTKVHDGARTTYSYDAANQLEWSEDASGRTTYTFDADGNQQVMQEPNGDRTTNTWDYENRMTRVELPSGIRNTMAYEPGGLRVKLEESTGTKKFVWDDQNYLAETDENDDTQVVYTNEPRLYGNLVSQRRGTESHWYHFVAIGSTTALTNVSQNVTDAQRYDAWGNVVHAEVAIGSPFGFVGETGYWSHASGMYVRDRQYCPRNSRWLSVDPISVDASFNKYMYSFNRPTLFADPSGAHPALIALCAGCWTYIGILVYIAYEECSYDPYVDDTYGGSYALCMLEEYDKAEASMPSITKCAALAACAACGGLSTLGKKAAVEGGEQLAKRRLRKELLGRIAECEALYRTYKKNCDITCKNVTNCTQLIAIVGQLVLCVRGRQEYLRKHCDDILEGSISRGGTVARDGHVQALTQAGQQLNRCRQKMLDLCSTAAVVPCECTIT